MAELIFKHAEYGTGTEEMGMNGQSIRIFSPAILTAAASVYAYFPQLFDGLSRLWLLIPTAVLIMATTYVIPALVGRSTQSKRRKATPLSTWIFFGSLGLTFCAIVALALIQIPFIGVCVFVAQIILALGVSLRVNRVHKNPVR